MKLLKITIAAAALILSLSAAACDNTQTAQNSNANARPAPAAPAATPATAATPDELAAASADFNQFCANCHKADGRGGAVELEPGHKIEVESLREHGLRDSDAELATQIREGGDDMPAFKGKLDDQRINNLVRYIRREFHGRNVSAPAASPAAAATPATPAKSSH